MRCGGCNGGDFAHSCGEEKSENDGGGGGGDTINTRTDDMYINFISCHKSYLLVYQGYF